MDEQCMSEVDKNAGSMKAWLAIVRRQVLPPSLRWG